MATEVAEARTLELRLLVRAGARPPTPVELRAPGSAPVAAVRDALAAALDADPGDVLLCRTGAWLDPASTLGASALRHGDVLDLAPAGTPDAAPVPPLELVVAGGPSSGRRFPLAPGNHDLGRDPACAFVLDDTALSGRHLRVEVASDLSVTVADLGSRNGSAVEGETLDPETSKPVAAGDLVSAGRTLLAVQEPAHQTQAAAAPDGTLPFNRPPRVRRPLEPAMRPFPAPPDPPQRGRLPLGASLVPLALGLGLYFVTKVPTMLFFSTLSPVMALTTYVEDRRSGRKSFERRSREYKERLTGLADELAAERADEVRSRRAAAPGAATLLDWARLLEPSLWERRPADPDFLALRVGSADGQSLLGVRLEPGGSEPLRKEAESVASFFAVAPSVPVTVPLGDAGSVGLCGPDDAVDSLARWLVVQAATLHSPLDLTIGAALGDGRAASWSWLRWLPHTAETRLLETPIAWGPVAARALVERAAALVGERRTLSDAGVGGRRRGPALLLVLDESVAPERPLVEALVAGASDAGVAVVWLGSRRRDLPGACGGIVELEHASAKLAITDARTGAVTSGVSADGLAPDLAEDLALALAPVRDTSSAGDAASVPDSAALLELLDAGQPLSGWIDERWQTGEDLSAVVGVSASGPVVVDLRRDGPHALVAGMTGAGKSELLQTLIASLASRLPPTRLAFLLVDYKGGAAFKECAELPHAVGLVTDLDAHLTQRALASLNAELRRRERILREAGAKDLADMERRDLEHAPPSLVIVIDEFATLAKEVPEFIDGIVDVAQRGRSLGVHLVLATQRPGGIVSENIRANTNIRIALRVGTPAESTDVIGVQDAALIPRRRPGRAYLRTGHAELTELQVAYSGAPPPRTGAAEEAIVVRRLDRGDDAVPAYDDLEDETELRLLVDAAADVTRARALPRQPSPWLPPLPALLALESLQAAERPDAEAVVGLLDEPERQTQEALTVDLEAEGSVLVYGTSGSGKTAFLRTLALAFAAETSPTDLQVYALDFATRGLAPLLALPHCGAVIAADEEERTERLFAVLRTTLERRKAQFADKGVFSLSEWRRVAPDEPLARIVVLLDNYAGFASAFERVNLGELVDALPRLVGDGRPLGVHFVVTADRRGAVPNSLAGIIPSKLVLRMADDDEYVSLGVPPRALRGAQLPPGRGFLPGGIEFQIAVPGADASGSGQTAALASVGQQLSTLHRGLHASPIEPLPVRVARTSLPAPTRPLGAVIGIGDLELDAVEVELDERHFLVAGPYRSGRSTALGTIAASLAGGGSDELYLLAPRRSPLAGLDLWRASAQGEEQCARLASELAARLEGKPFVLVVDDGEELAESVAAPVLETIVRRGRDVGVRVVAASERQAAQRAFGGWLRELRKEEHGLLLVPDLDVDGDILGTRLPRRTNPVFPPGRGYLVRRDGCELVQVAA